MSQSFPTYRAELLKELDGFRVEIDHGDPVWYRNIKLRNLD